MTAVVDKKVKVPKAKAKVKVKVPKAKVKVPKAKVKVKVKRSVRPDGWRWPNSLEKSSRTVDMTVRDFQSGIGLDKDPVGYVAAAAVLRMLVKKGIAREIARFHLGGEKVGRKSLVYRLPVRLVLKTVAVDDEAA